MPSDHRPDDEDTQEGNQHADHSAGPTALDASAHGGSAGGPGWSSQAGRGDAPWQTPAEPASQWPPGSSAGWQHQAGQPQQQGWQQPPQQGWQQPPQQGWQQPPQQGWQQPGWQQPPQWQSQQAWGQAGYWPARPEYPNNALVVASGVILVVFGVFATFVGLVGLVVGSFAAAMFEQYLPPDAGLDFDFSAITTLILVVFGIVLLIGILHFLSAIGIFLHKGWARAIGIVLAVLGLLVGVVGVVGALQEAGAGAQAGRDLVVPVVVALCYGLTLFSLIAGGNHFSRRY